MSFLSNSEKSGIRKRISSISFKKKSKRVDFIIEDLEENSNRDYEQEDKYHYIKDFDNTDESVCIIYDKKNQDIYDKNVKFYTECKEYLKNKRANFSISESPKPPRKPSNHQMYLDYKKRNVKHNCINQSLAVIYLLNKGYKLIKDSSMYDNEKQMIEHYCFEPYMAIELAETLSQNHNENYKNVNLVCNYYVLSNYNSNSNFSNNINNNINNNFKTPISPKPSAPPASHNIQYNNLLSEFDKCVINDNYNNETENRIEYKK